MSAANKSVTKLLNAFALVVGVTISLCSLHAHAMVPLEEEEMSGVTGEGLAFAFDDFRFQMAGTSFFEHVGAEPQGDTVFNRGDLRWIGTTISSGAARSTDDGGEGAQTAYAYHQWDNLTGASECSTAGNPLGCPIAIGGAQGYVEVNNPYVLRVREHEGVGWNGSSWVTGFENPVVELVGATNSDPFRWAFWGEIDALEGEGVKSQPGIDVGSASRLGKLQNQEIILGAPVSRLNPNAGDGKENIVGPVFQMYKNWSNDAYANDTLGMLYHHRLSGDYRFSVHQNGQNPGGITNDRNSPNHGNAAYGEVPHFTDREGMYFMNVNTYLPLGQLHYQSMIVGGVGPNDPTGAAEGNFFLELTRIPDDPTAYEDFYALPGDSIDGYVTAAQRWDRSDRYYHTHGYARWGEMFPESGGVSSHRFHLLDDTYTVHLPEQATNTMANDICGNNRTGNCEQRNGNASAITISIPYSSKYSSTDSSFEEVLNDGGMVFVSSGDGWVLPYNPAMSSANFPTQSAIQGDKDIQRARTVGEQWSCGLWNLGTCYGMYARIPPDEAALRTRVSAMMPENPSLRVNAVNLGSSRAEGMLIQHLKITSLGAAAP